MGVPHGPSLQRVEAITGVDKPEGTEEAAGGGIVDAPWPSRLWCLVHVCKAPHCWEEKGGQAEGQELVQLLLPRASKEL